VSTERTDPSLSRGFVGTTLRVFDLLIDAGAVISAALLVAIMLATTIKIVFRYLLHQSLIGVDQLSGMLLLYVAFFGAAWVLRRDEHVTIDLLVAHVGGRTRWYLAVASSFIGAAVCLALAVFGTVEVIGSIQRGIRIPAEIEMPRAVNLWVIPLGFLFLTLQFIRRTVDTIKARDAHIPPPVSVV
jgi:TRAP-type C4-dicarboxylate transport system permease small subunit